MSDDRLNGTEHHYQYELLFILIMMMWLCEFSLIFSEIKCGSDINMYLQDTPPPAPFVRTTALAWFNVMLKRCSEEMYQIQTSYYLFQD